MRVIQWCCFSSHGSVSLSQISSAGAPAFITKSFTSVHLMHSSLILHRSFSPLQEACLQGNLIANCLEQLSDPHPLLRQWVAICLGRIWQNFDPARWCGVRDSAHEKLYTLLSDPIPEVRRQVLHALSNTRKSLEMIKTFIWGKRKSSTA